MAEKWAIEKSNAERAALISRAANLRAGIEQIFNDAASWNEHSRARKEGCDPVDPDPGGQLRRLADGLDCMLRANRPTR